MSGDLHVLVIGAGGLGCPAGLALAAEGVERVTFVDPDVVEPSNLPRQVLFEPEDVGRPKAHAAAARLAAVADVRTEGVQDRFDEHRLARLGASAHVWVDATDGAWVKDWVSRAAVYARRPLAHAAGLRSEGRRLAVPAGGRPCLACLFGRLDGDGGSCADLGVWNGVVGVTGALAALLALRLAAGDLRRPTYDVLDFTSSRAMTLGARPDPACPVCGGEAVAPGPLAAGPACDIGAVGASDAPALEAVTATLDLISTRCPLNLLRAREALDAAPRGARLRLRLGAEGAATVPDGVRAAGHRVVASTARGDGVDLVVEVMREGPPQAVARGIDVERYARQVVLPEVGVAGQRRLLDAEVVVTGSGLAARTAARYLAAAGVTVRRRAGPGVEVVLPDATRIGPGADGGALVVGMRPQDACAVDAPRGAIGVALGALVADEVQRRLVQPEPTRRASLDLAELVDQKRPSCS
ncbi:MAG: ThiF family adenylyltransferase [Planctomycetota bacterium]